MEEFATRDTFLRFHKSSPSFKLHYGLFGEKVGWLPQSWPGKDQSPELTSLPQVTEPTKAFFYSFPLIFVPGKYKHLLPHCWPPYISGWPLWSNPGSFSTRGKMQSKKIPNVSQIACKFIHEKIKYCPDARDIIIIIIITIKSCWNFKKDTNSLISGNFT